MNYHEIPMLSGVYLEDSYVLAVREYDCQCVFELDVVLKEDHPSYRPPHAGEQYCYKKASLIFSGASYVEWICKSFIQFFDAAGENDYGNIDSFTIDGNCCSLDGDWGSVKIVCSSIELSFDN